MKIIRQLVLLLLSAVFSYGLVILWNGFKIFSFPRFLIESLLILPVVFLAENLVLHYFPQPNQLSELKPLRKQILFAAATLLAVSFLLVPSYSGAYRYLITVSIVFLTLVIWCAFALLPVWRAQSPYLKNATLIVTLFAGVAGLAIYIFLALHSRLYGDDFCYYSRTLTMGYWSTVVDFYYHWSGRVSSTFLVFSASGFWFSPLVLISLVSVTFFIFVYGISERLKDPQHWIWSLTCAALLPFLIYALSPDPYKSLFWIVSLVIGVPVTLLLPLFLLWVQKVFTRKKINAYLYAVIGFALAFIIATIHESPTVAMIILTGFLLLVMLLDKEKKPGQMALVSAALAGSLAGFIVTITAPGNAARHDIQGYLPPPGFFTVLKLSSTFFFEYLLTVTKQTGWIFLIPALFLGYYAGKSVRRGWIAPLAVSGVAILMAWSSFLPGAYTAQVSIPPRTQLVPTTFLVLGAFCAAYVSPRLKAQTFTMAVLAVYLLLSVFFIRDLLRDEYRLVPPMVKYAQDWDARDQLLRSTNAKAQSINVPWDENEQKIQCVDEYYSIIRSR